MRHSQQRCYSLEAELGVRICSQQKYWASRKNSRTSVEFALAITTKHLQFQVF
jgi:hypothetical protein